MPATRSLSRDTLLSYWLTCTTGAHDAPEKFGRFHEYEALLDWRNNYMRYVAA